MLKSFRRLIVICISQFKDKLPARAEMDLSQIVNT